MEAVRNVLRAARRIDDRLRDASLGVQTCSETKAPQGDAEIHDNQPTPYFLLRRLRRAMAVTSEDVVCDVGCGTGRIVCFFSTTGVKSSIGVEIVPQIADAARRNAAVVRRRRAEVQIVTADAATYTFDGVTRFILFNPFGAKTLSSVMTNIRHSVTAHPRTAFVYYFNPVHEALLQTESAWMVAAPQLDVVTGYGHRVAVYRIGE